MPRRRSGEPFAISEKQKGIREREREKEAVGVAKGETKMLGKRCQGDIRVKRGKGKRRRREEEGERRRERGEEEEVPETRPSVKATITSTSSLCAEVIWEESHKRTHHEIERKKRKERETRRQKGRSRREREQRERGQGRGGAGNACSIHNCSLR